MGLLDKYFQRVIVGFCAEGAAYILAEGVQIRVIEGVAVGTDVDIHRIKSERKAVIVKLPDSLSELRLALALKQVVYLNI